LTVFIAVLGPADKAEALRRSCAVDAEPGCRFLVDIANVTRIPGSPFAYWLSDSVRQIFERNIRFEDEGRKARIGASSKNNFRFLRGWWEVGGGGDGKLTWINFAKGGSTQLYYADLDLLINWTCDAAEIEAEQLQKYPYLGANADFVLHRENEYGRPGITWTLRAARFSPEILPANSVFSDRGYSAHVPEGEIFWTLAVFSSTPFDYLFKTSLGRHGHPEFLVGVLQRMPWVCPGDDDRATLTELARRGWSLRRLFHTCSEVSHAFVAPALLHNAGASFVERVALWGERVASIEVELNKVQVEVDDLCFELYEISGEDQRAITEGFGVTTEVRDDADDAEDAEDADEEYIEADPLGLAAGLVSWAVGVAAGRFDIRLATGDRHWPAEPPPLDPLPMCSPAMLVSEDGSPVIDAPEGYPVWISPVLVEDPGHRLDLATRVRAVFDVIFGDDADRWWADVGATLGARGGDIQTWLAKGFFEHHLKAHSKSRRKAPLLWPIGTRTGSYLVWLYAHRMSSDTLFQLLNDLVAPKVTLEEQLLTRLRQDAGSDPTASQRKSIEKQEIFVAELRELRAEIEALTPVWAPDLNDGIVIVLAPLWRLFTHHRAWSKELKQQWGKLSNGEYDWAKLAMHLWPERVISKCAEDRSVAIAHGLEAVFWFQNHTGDDMWHPRVHPTVSVDQLIAERQNPAVVAALQHLANT
jgi:hypothetical protein